MRIAVVVVVALASAPAFAEGKLAHVVVYDGWATSTSLRVTGRLLERAADAAPSKTTSAAANLIDNLDALESDEIANAELSVTVAGQAWATRTDVDGNFEVIAKNLPAAQALTPGRTRVDVVVVAPADYRGQRGSGSLFVHPAGPSVGLISDIDDTVVKTFVTDKKRMLEQVLLKNAAQLEPVVGAAKNYQEAQKRRPLAFFYVSGSPQNLYVRLHRFLDDNGFPGGPILLKNLGDDNLFAQDDYKIERIEKILAAFPLMRFVLVGDTGERDPEIYAHIRKHHKDRVVAVVIRKVAGSKHLEPERFKGFTLVDDAYAADDVVAALLGP
jgi:phosphatidate phosphatase APP1